MNEIRDPNWMTHLWQRVKSLFSDLDARVTALEQGGGGGGGAVSGVKGDAEATYRTGAVNLTAANIGAKAIQTAVSDPVASGTAVEFIAGISQDTQGVITPAKKSVPVATQSSDGLLSAADKTKLDGIAAGAQVNTITGVKGDAESSYRTGNVNLTPANLGLDVDCKMKNMSVSNARVINITVPRSSVHFILASNINPTLRAYVGIVAATSTNTDLAREFTVAKGTGVSVTTAANQIVTLDIGANASEIRIVDIVMMDGVGGFVTATKVS